MFSNHNISVNPTILEGLRDKLDVPEGVRKKAKGNLSFIGGPPKPIKGGEDGIFYIIPVKRE
jgi:hypothetical protein